jgi:hypothetical protein
VTAEERKMQRPLVLANLDGGNSREANAIAQARNPTYDTLLREPPNTLLRMRRGRGLRILAENVRQPERILDRFNC